MLVGEQFVKEVYTSLISNQDAWRKTLLLITFDEFVGTFDPATGRLKEDKENPVVQPPWGQHGQAPPFSPNDLPTQYGFDSLGARVPTILVSPYVQKGTVFRSSTVPDDPSTAPMTTLRSSPPRSNGSARAGRRLLSAPGPRLPPTFDQVLTLDQPRTDETALAFLDTPRAIGDPVHLYRRVPAEEPERRVREQLLLHAAGPPPGPARLALSPPVDLGIGAYFPTLGGPKQAVLSFVTHSPDPPAQISNNAQVMLVSREPGLSNYNMLGAWANSHDCYYYSEYFYGDDAAKETWILQKLASTDQPLHYGDQVYLVNSYYTGQRLTRDTRWLIGSGWITTGADGDYWTVEPAPARVAVRTTQPWTAPRTCAWWQLPSKAGPAALSCGAWTKPGRCARPTRYPQAASGPAGRMCGTAPRPGSLISVTAAQQNDGTVRIWVVDVNNALYSNAQTSPGGNWTGWSTPLPPRAALGHGRGVPASRVPRRSAVGRGRIRDAALHLPDIPGRPVV